VLASTLAQVLMLTRGFNEPETRAAGERARDLAEKGGNLAQLVARVHGIWRGLMTAGDYSTAGLLADRILYLAQREGSPTSFGLACYAQLNVSFYRGDLIGAEERFARLSGFLDVDDFSNFPLSCNSYRCRRLLRCSLGSRRFRSRAPSPGDSVRTG
jgi:hypothetical protein